MDLISPSLLANILKHSKKCHKRFCLGVGEWTKFSDESSEVPKLKRPKKKLKLSVKGQGKLMAICG